MVVQEFNKYWIKYQKSADEMVKEFVDWQENKLKENNMEDRNKTVAELIADLQNKLDRANNRIEGLVKENDELKERNNTQFTKLKTAINSVYGLTSASYPKEIKKLKNENEYLEKEITKWRSKYTKEKTKHDKATKMIDELKKHQNRFSIIFFLEIEGILS